MASGEMAGGMTNNHPVRLGIFMLNKIEWNFIFFYEVSHVDVILVRRDLTWCTSRRYPTGCEV
jgi:hypothetical protein